MRGAGEECRLSFLKIRRKCYDTISMLKRLELVGFKSFSQKTVLEFPPGITAIVGPNGSGKSNIIDALRWILGERDANKLRGAKSENLIFSGTSRTSRVGMASVSVYFDNSKKMLPIDFNEVVVTRRIFRDGNAEYLINKSQVRLKDVVDFFAQSKMGTKGFSIVNQGNADLFVKASPQERRDMMEEILGLRQFQIKKHESKLKLKSAQTNLNQVTLTVEELLPHLRLLRRQTSKWEKRSEYQKELADLERLYFGGKYALLLHQKNDIESRLQQIQQEILQKEKELVGHENDARAVEEHKPQQDSYDARFELQRALAQCEAQLGVLDISTKKSGSRARYNEEECINLLNTLRKEMNVLYNQNDLQCIKKTLQELEKKIVSILEPKKDEDAEKRTQSIIEQVEKNRIRFTHEMEEIQKKLKDIEDEAEKKRASFENFNRLFREAFQAVSAKKSDIQRLEAQKNHIIFEKDRWEHQWNELKDRAQQADYKLEENTNISPVEKSDYSQLESRMNRVRHELALIGDIDEEVMKEAKEVEERYAFLSHQGEDLQKAITDLHVLIIDLDKKIHVDFNTSLALVNEQLVKYFKTMFGEGKAQLVLVNDRKKNNAHDEESNPHIIKEGVSDKEMCGEEDDHKAIDIDIAVPSKGIRNLELLSGGEKSLVSIAVLFSLISISPPPFLVFDEVDAALDEKNSRRFATVLKEFAHTTQFAVVTHNRSVMEAGDVLYGVTMDTSGTSKLLSLKIENA